ncbi:MAG: CoA pyrophosphatase, partial [Deltaproteobacteria bacterium]|nr:CoA pyrophosphatase [Deltaproteobacteria bacterium]
IGPYLADRRHAAVALILAGPEDHLSLAMIHRAARTGDPWSGHVAFPGGRAEPEDGNPRRVAERETLEEIGLDLGGAEFLAPLSEENILHVVPPMVLSPFVYYWGAARPPFALNDEVDEAFWMDLSQLTAPDSQTTHTLDWGGQTVTFPAIHCHGRILWGLSWRVWDDFLKQAQNLQ